MSQSGNSQRAKTDAGVVAQSGNLSAINYAIDIVNVSKRFRRRTIGRNSYTTLKSSLLDFFRFLFANSKSIDSPESTVTEVLKDLTLRIPRGSSVGIIGRNGAGKSTFLKLVTGIYKPDSGSIKVNGRVAALIELGAGFHPDFSGRENLFLAGVMLGLSRQQIAERFAQIVSFAELEQVIDDPVRTYSSGMFMRLGFSLAVHTDPDVLLIDEVLAVGDAAFTVKCKEQIAHLRKEGKTLLLVTHDLDAVERWCDEVLWLEKGEVKDRGDPRRVIDHYRQFVARGEELELLEEVTQSNAELPNADAGSLQATAATALGDAEIRRWGSREVEITAVRVHGASGEEHRSFTSEDSVRIEFDYRCNQGISDLVFGIGLERSDGLSIHGSNTDLEHVLVDVSRVTGTVRYQIDRIGLLDGTYLIDVAAHRKDGYPYDYHKGVVRFVVRSAHPQVGVVVPPHHWELR